MLRLAAKLVSFFWRREDIPEEEVGTPRQELSEGKGSRGAQQEALGQAWEVGRAVTLRVPLGFFFYRERHHRSVWFENRTSEV